MNLPLLLALTAAVLLGLPRPESLGSMRKSIILSMMSSFVPDLGRSNISHILFSCLISNLWAKDTFLEYSSESFLNSKPLNLLIFFFIMVVFPTTLYKRRCNSLRSSFLKRDMEASTRGMSPSGVPEPLSNSIFVWKDNF